MWFCGVLVQDNSYIKMAAKFPRADHLTNEEVDYELIIRGRRDETKDDLNVKHRLLRNLFFEDVRENRTYNSRYTMDQEYDYIASKLDILNKRLQKGHDDKSISRLKHYLMRVERCVADDPRSLQLRDELCQEIHSILSRFSAKDLPTKETVELEQESGAIGGQGIDSPIREHDNSDKMQGKTNEQDEENAVQHRTSKGSLGALPKANSVANNEPSQTLLEQENEELRNKIYLLEKQLTEMASRVQNSTDNMHIQTVHVQREYPLRQTEAFRRDQDVIRHSDRRSTLGKEFSTGENYRNLETVRRDFQNCEPNDGPAQGNRHSFSASNLAVFNEQQESQFSNRRNLDYSMDDNRNRWRNEPSEHSDRGYPGISLDHTRGNNVRMVGGSPSQPQRNSRIFNRRNDARTNWDYLDEEGHSEYPRMLARRPINEFEIINADRRMEKWHLTFSGDSRQRSLEDFLHKVRRLARMDRIEEHVLLQRIHTILRGEAYDWYLCYSDEFLNWGDFEERIRYMYGNPNKDQGNRQKIYERKQQRNETFLAFKMELERLNKLLSTPLDQGRLFEIIWDNMRPHYRSKLACITVRDLNMLEYYAYRIDANDSSLRQREGPLKANNAVHNIQVATESEDSYSAESETEEVYEIGKKFDKTKRVTNRTPISSQSRANRENVENTSIPVCWNCDKSGHLWRYCKDPKRIFCYACGNPGKTTVSCPNHSRETQQPVQHSGN